MQPAGTMKMWRLRAGRGPSSLHVKLPLVHTMSSKSQMPCTTAHSSSSRKSHKGEPTVLFIVIILSSLSSTWASSGKPCRPVASCAPPPSLDPFPSPPPPPPPPAQFPSSKKWLLLMSRHLLACCVIVPRSTTPWVPMPEDWQLLLVILWEWLLATLS